MTPAELQTLAAECEEDAHEAEWYAHDGRVFGSDGDGIAQCFGNAAHLATRETRAAFIAAMSPAVALRLLEAVQSAKYLADAAEWMSLHPNDKNGWADLDRTRDAFRDAFAKLGSNKPVK